MRNFKIIQKICGISTALFTTRSGIVKLLILLLLLALVAAVVMLFRPKNEDDEYALDEASKVQVSNFMTAWDSKHCISLKSEKYINITINNGSDYQIIKDLSQIVESGCYMGSQPKFNITIIDRDKFLIAIVRATSDENGIQEDALDIMTKSKKKGTKWFCRWSERTTTMVSRDSSLSFTPAAAARPVGAGR